MAVFLALALACNGETTAPGVSIAVGPGVGSGTGTVTSIGGGSSLSCTIAPGSATGNCRVDLDQGQQVTLTATPATGSVFVGWSGQCSGTGSCGVTVDTDMTVNATFEATNRLVVLGDGSGSGNVVSEPTGISCTISAGNPTGSCAASFEDDALVTLTATPTGGSVFAGWSGACAGTGSCVVVMSEGRTVTATFTPPYTLTVSGAGEGSGAVASQDMGPTIECEITAGVASGTCAASYESGTVVSLVATPGAENVFAGWSGDCAGVGSCEVMMSQLRSVTATFSPRFDLTVRGGGEGDGTVESQGATPAIDCTITAGAPSGTCEGTYDPGTVLTLVATPGADNVFAGWSGACAGIASCVVTMSEARTVTATFTPPYAISVLGAGAGSGTVESQAASPAIDCTVTAGVTSGTCEGTYVGGTVVTLEATPDAGSVFGGWSGACTGTAACEVTMSEARTVTATFTPQFDLSVLGGGAGSGTVVSEVVTPAIDCTIVAGSTSGTCEGTYVAGTVVTLVATPDAGNVFAGWSGACTGTAGCEVTMSEARTVAATFTPPNVLTVLATGPGSGSVESQGADPAIDCTITAGATGGTCDGTYLAGTVVTLVATPDAGNVFEGWSGACTGTANCEVSMSQARTVTAEFTPQFDLTVLGAGAGSGTVASQAANPAIDCTITAGSPSGACEGTYDVGTVVTLVATPDGGNLFSGWSGACAGTASCEVTMSEARTVTATFTPTQALTVSGTGSGMGDVTSSPSLIDCTITAGVTSGTCDGPFEEGTVVTLTAVPNAGSVFDEWSGEGCTGTGTCEVTMSQARAVTATFTQQFDLTVLGTGAGNGTVASQAASPAISCTITAGSPSGTCQGSYDVGTMVTLVATPSANNMFSEWTGACTGTGNCEVTMSQARTVTAEFTPLFDLTVLGGGGNGTVASQGASPAINCTITAGSPSGTCDRTYESGTVVTLLATPGANHVFGGWSGACTGTGNCEVTMSQARTVTATFTPTYLLTVLGDGDGTGDVTSSPVLIECASDEGVTSGTCAGSFESGTMVTLTATPDAGSVFDGWSGACTGTGSCEITMSQARNVTAEFGLQTFTITLTVQVVNGDSGSGSVTPAPPGGTIYVDKFGGPGPGPNSDTYTFNAGDIVTVSGSRTSSWFGVYITGACTDSIPGNTGGTASCQVTMDDDKDVFVTFN